MRLGTAIERLVDNYKYASDKEWIQDKVAWALYYTWKEADDHKTEPQYDAEEVAKDINRRVDLIKREWEVRHKDEPQTNADQHVQHVESVETMSCQECLWCADGQETCANPSLCVYKPKAEPQTDCTTCDQVGRCERGRAVECPLTNQQTERSRR